MYDQPELPLSPTLLQLRSRGVCVTQRILENEFGGMSEAFTTLHTIVGDAAYLRFVASPLFFQFEE